MCVSHSCIWRESTRGILSHKVLLLRMFQNATICSVIFLKITFFYFFLTFLCIVLFFKLLLFPAPTHSFLTPTFLPLLKGSIKKKLEKFRRWSTSSGGSFKRPSKPPKTLSLSSPTEEEEPQHREKERERRRLRPIVASVFGQVSVS